jgi:hypothetical protein
MKRFSQPLENKPFDKNWLLKHLPGAASFVDDPKIQYIVVSPRELAGLGSAGVSQMPALAILHKVIDQNDNVLFYLADDYASKMTVYSQLTGGRSYPKNIDNIFGSLSAEHISTMLHGMPGTQSQLYPMTQTVIEKTPTENITVEKPKETPDPTPYNPPAQTVAKPQVPSNAGTSCHDLVEPLNDGSGKIKIKDNVKMLLENIARMLHSKSQVVLSYSIDGNPTTGAKCLQLIKKEISDPSTRKLIYLAATCKQRLFSDHSYYLGKHQTVNPLYDVAEKPGNQSIRDWFVNFLTDLYAHLADKAPKNPSPSILINKPTWKDWNAPSPLAPANETQAKLGAALDTMCRYAKDSVGEVVNLKDDIYMPCYQNTVKKIESILNNDNRIAKDDKKRIVNAIKLELQADRINHRTK